MNKLGVDINVKGKNGKTPLHYAAKNGHEEIVKLLLKNGADVNAQNKYDLTALELANKAEHKGIVKLFFQHEVELRLKNRVDINVKDQDGYTLLHCVAKEGYHNIAELLLKNGAKVNAQSQSGKTSLHYAAKNGHVEIVKLLLKNGADVKAKNKYDLTALNLANKAEHKGIVDLLFQYEVELGLKNWADVYYEDQDGNILLYRAAKNEHVEIAELLLKNGAKVDIINNYNEAPLHCAICDEDIDIVKFLLKNGADVNVKDRNGNTPLHWAILRRNTGLVNLLLKNEANVNVKSDHGFYYPMLEGEGSTPVQAAAESGCMEILFLLLLFGADISAEDRIKMNGNPKLASCLEEFERIKAIPLFDRMIEAHKGGNIKAILPLINNREALIKDLQEIEERCNSNEQLSFISQYLYDFMKYMEPKIKQAYKIKKCKTKAVSSLINTRYENIKLSPKLSIISKILLWIKQCFYKIMPFLTKNIDDALPEKQCHNNNFHDVAGNIAQYLSTKDLQNLALVYKDINISVNNEKECSEKRINRSMGRLMTDVKQVLDEPTTIGIYGSFIEH
ncbi:ankyrin repeat domain-containing protein [Candidatus Mesenet endosymbiont of Phosphuga atrata]|uniref:ankyrin repeat domain-containing protein n=1 Tax=Candidatus Mesenet endosymbiont of Phosphuga atrata TaxID=3066221 RepID=UPI0030CED9F7